MACCLNDLGSKPHNEAVNIGIEAEQVGEYKYLLDFNGAKITKTQTVEIGDDLIVPKYFNEDYGYNFVIIQPDGTKLEYNECENFYFQTYLAIGECNQGNCEEEETETYS